MADTRVTADFQASPGSIKPEAVATISVTLQGGFDKNKQYYAFWNAAGIGEFVPFGTQKLSLYKEQGTELAITKAKQGALKVRWSAAGVPPQNVPISVDLYEVVE